MGRFHPNKGARGLRHVVKEGGGWGKKKPGESFTGAKEKVGV